MDNITGEKPSLRDRLSRFFKETITKLNEKVVLHRSFVNVGTELVKGIAQFAIYKEPASLVEGAFAALKEIGSQSSFYPRDLFHPRNGWEQLTYRGINIGHLFVSVLEKYPCQNLKFDYHSSAVRTIEMPLGKIGLVQQGEGEYLVSTIYFRPTETDENALRQFLIDEFIALLNTKCFSVADNKGYYNSNITIVAEDLLSFHSKRTEEYLDYIQGCLDKGINRSIIFYGPPGSGKTSLASSVIKELGFRSLKFRYSLGYDFSVFKFVIQAFNIEAVFIDDLEVSANDASAILEFLEFLKREVKVVIACANVIDGLHGAVIRPGRIDHIVKIDTLERETIKALLGKLDKTYGKKVAHWPVAYIREFVHRAEIGIQPMTKAFTELNARVKKQLVAIKQ